MNNTKSVEKIKKTSITHLPHLGQRIIKTAIAVFLCFAIHYAIGYKGLMLQSAITAIICIQPYFKDTKDFAINRGLGTLLGGIWGLVFLLIFSEYPILVKHELLEYFLISVGILVVIYSTVAIRLSDTAGLAAITFLCIVIGLDSGDSPLITTLLRLFDTLIGIVVALFVNLARLPRVRAKNKIFFLRLKDLVVDRLSEIDSGTLIALNRLYNDGARISLVSPWAPAHIISQIEDLQIATPSIVMDGAALYDISDRKYIKLDCIEYEDANLLCHTLKDMNLGYCVYAVRNNTTLIYRQGNLNEAEQMELDKLESSDLRNYIDGFYTKDDKICCVRTIDTNDVIDELAIDLEWSLPPDTYRFEVRQQPFLKEYSGLYIYSVNSSVEKMKDYLFNNYYREESDTLERVDLIPISKNYDPSKDSIHLIHRLRHLYEHLGFRKKTDSKNKDSKEASE
ncbi:MAG: FUSC family protein [Lachnospiraceae bacterium]|nr:FUSC family protein [Lachnospiraceae bacterium]